MRTDIYIRGVEGRGEEIRDLFMSLGAKEPEYYPTNFEFPFLLYYIEADGSIRAHHEESTFGKLMQAMDEEIFLPSR